MKKGQSMWVGTIDYKQLHDILLRRKRELDEQGLQDNPEYAELKNMMISVRNMYRVRDNIPINWKFGDPHPITDRKGWERAKRKKK